MEAGGPGEGWVRGEGWGRSAAPWLRVRRQASPDCATSSFWSAGLPGGRVGQQAVTTPEEGGADAAAGGRQLMA